MKKVKKAGGYADFVHTQELVRKYLGDDFDWVAFGQAFDESNQARRAMAREVSDMFCRTDRPAATKSAIAAHAAAIVRVGR